MLAVLWGLLAGAAGLLMLLLIGLHGAFQGGGPLFNPPFIALIALFVVSIVSCIGEIMAARGESSPGKARAALVFAALPLVGVAVLIAAGMLAAGN